MEKVLFSVGLRRFTAPRIRTCKAVGGTRPQQGRVGERLRPGAGGVKVCGRAMIGGCHELFKVGIIPN
jgi:hypothetical protein